MPLTHVVADQRAALDLLSAASTHRINEAVTRIDTHGAVIFLAGPVAYKVKRAVRFTFMDFSTVEKRRAACEAEVAINTIDAPDLYLGTVAITQSPTGLELGGQGKAVEWAVRMRRFDSDLTVDHIADAGALTSLLVTKLTRTVLASHARATRREGGPATASLARYIVENRDAFLRSPELFQPESVSLLTRRAEAAFAEVQALLLSRGEAGFVRRCHGDLHLRNLVLLKGEPTLFDAIEFDEAIATGDVLYDLAFLLMDLCQRNLRHEANQILNRYLAESDEANLEGLAALPLFLALRAGIRAKVDAAGLAHHDGEERERSAAEAGHLFSTAERFLAPAEVRLVAIGGLSGTGKSVVSADVAPHLGRAPGAVHLRSDVERKAMFGVADTERLPATAYHPEITSKVYARLLRKARLVASAGYCVIIDAVHAREEERRRIEEMALSLKIAFFGFWLEAPTTVLRSRVEGRRGDASDADASIVELQTRYDVGEISWRRLDASGVRQDLCRAIQSSLTTSDAVSRK